MKRSFHSLTYLIRKRQAKRLLACIENADNILIQQVIQAVIRRYGTVFPEWEVVFYALPKDPHKRQTEMQTLIQFLQRHEMQRDL